MRGKAVVYELALHYLGQQVIFVDGAELQTNWTPGVILIVREVYTLASVGFVIRLAERSFCLYESTALSFASCYSSECGRIVLLAESLVGEFQLRH